MIHTPMELRAICGHDSRSVDGCLHCEAADEIEALRLRLNNALNVLEECRTALSEELSAWDIDPPLHHVKQAHDRADALLQAANA